MEQDFQSPEGKECLAWSFICNNKLSFEYDGIMDTNLHGFGQFVSHQAVNIYLHFSAYISYLKS